MPSPKKPKKPSVADQFSDDEMNKVKHYGQMLGGGVTPFDEAVEEALNKRDAAEEASAKKMHAAQTGGGDLGTLGPTQAESQAVKQRGSLQQQATATGAMSAAQAQGAEAPVNAPPAPAGAQGETIPFSAQKGAVGGPGKAPQATLSPVPSAPPSAPGGGPAQPPPETGEEEGPPQ